VPSCTLLQHFQPIYYKGLGHEMNMKAYNIESAFYEYDDASLVYKFLGCLVDEKKKYADFACF
jgi:hypothetical protein